MGKKRGAASLPVGDEIKEVKVSICELTYSETLSVKDRANEHYFHFYSDYLKDKKIQVTFNLPNKRMLIIDHHRNSGIPSQVILKTGPNKKVALIKKPLGIDSKLISKHVLIEHKLNGTKITAGYYCKEIDEENILGFLLNELNIRRRWISTPNEFKIIE